MMTHDGPTRTPDIYTNGPSSGTSGETPGASGRDPEFWNGRAPEFSKHAVSTGYAERFIALMDPDPAWSVLDMGCGGGTLAIPLARKVASVTAVDFSSGMLDVVKRRCSEEGITNVTAVQAAWEDDWESLGVGTHDAAIASRSLIGDAPSEFIRKLDGAARKAVFISTLVGDGPFDRRLFESSGRQFQPSPDYIHYYNLLYGMGIRASVAFVEEKHRNAWESHEQALDDQQWMFRGMTDEERKSVSEYLKKNLVEVDGAWRLSYSRDCRWAVIWWSKDEKAR